MKHAFNSFKEFFRYIFKKKVDTKIVLKDVVKTTALISVVALSLCLFACTPGVHPEETNDVPTSVVEPTVTIDPVVSVPVTEPDTTTDIPDTDPTPDTTTNILNGYDKIPDTVPPVVDIPTSAVDTTDEPGPDDTTDETSTPDVTSEVTAQPVIGENGEISKNLQKALEYFGKTNATGSHFLAYYPETTADGGISIYRIVSGLGKGRQTNYLYFEKTADYEKAKLNYPGSSCIDEIQTIIVEAFDTDEVKNPANVPCVAFFGYIIYK